MLKYTSADSLELTDHEDLVQLSLEDSVNHLRTQDEISRWITFSLTFKQQEISLPNGWPLSGQSGKTSVIFLENFKQIEIGKSNLHFLDLMASWLSRHTFQKGIVLSSCSVPCITTNPLERKENRSCSFTTTRRKVELTTWITLSPCTVSEEKLGVGHWLCSSTASMSVVLRRIHCSWTNIDNGTFVALINVSCSYEKWQSPWPNHGWCREHQIHELCNVVFPSRWGFSVCRSLRRTHASLTEKEDATYAQEQVTEKWKQYVGIVTYHLVLDISTICARIASKTWQFRQFSVECLYFYNIVSLIVQSSVLIMT